MKKSLMFASALLTVVAGASLLTLPAQAQGNGFQDDTLVQRLAQKFGKNEDEVRAVFQEYHQGMAATHQQQLAARLDEQVASGVITTEQKQLIIDKLAQLKADHEDEMQNLSDEERRAKMEAQKAELEAWARENNIDLSLLRIGSGPQGPGMRGRPFGSAHGGHKGGMMQP